MMTSPFTQPTPEAIAAGLRRGHAERSAAFARFVIAMRRALTVRHDTATTSLPSRGAPC